MADGFGDMKQLHFLELAVIERRLAGRAATVRPPAAADDDDDEKLHLTAVSKGLACFVPSLNAKVARAREPSGAQNCVISGSGTRLMRCALMMRYDDAAFGRAFV